MREARPLRRGQDPFGGACASARDPALAALHCSLLPREPSRCSPMPLARFHAAFDFVLSVGPDVRRLPDRSVCASCAAVRVVPCLSRAPAPPLPGGFSSV